MKITITKQRTPEGVKFTAREVQGNPAVLGAIVLIERETMPADEELEALYDAAKAAPVVPQSIANWRCKSVLKIHNLFAQVEALIAALPPEQAVVIGTAWNGNADVERAGATVAAMSASLGLTPAQVDAMFIEASQLTV